MDVANIDSGVVDASLRSPRRRRLLWLLTLLAILVLLGAASVMIGSRSVAFEDLLAGLAGNTENISQAAIVKRIPRTVLALVVGAALGLSGAVMQAVTRNPLADPSILGVNMGAALAVVIGITYVGINTAHGYIWTAILGAGLAAVFVYVVGSLGRGGATPLKLALAGAATSAALASFVTAISLPRGDLADLIRSWQIGGVGGATFENVAPMLPFLAAGLLLAMLSANSLNSLALGDELAAGLGEKVMVVRVIAALAAVVLCGAATAVAGPIGFVGLVVPHLCRLLIGVDQRWLLPFSAVAGAALLILSDIIGRVIAQPGELDVGILTALIGAPVFIVIVRRSKIREL
ncbi:iron ABC transporter permease [Arthrobacter sp. MYb213]|uniref:FecCD family ABC transporter permease n=1 Tax=Arthrobacter sp. MYb213 TaxID=1848595 RepID=UPI000CFD773A|nr:iron ABC transporter permease [Arthrobacter sp. MYb213]PRB72784.1 iron ABC transporter permease [Arthrobacter sp. MYb213]